MSLLLNTFDSGYKEICEKLMEEHFPFAPGRLVFTNGCFDVLHPGHVWTLRYAREVAGPHGVVVVGLNSDASVKRLKGDARPVFDERSRATMLMSLRFVDNVIVFDEDTPAELLSELKPDVIVKGGDYKKEDVVGGDKCLVLIAKKIEGWSTTGVIERMKR